jgi:hypothetical protein
MVAAIKIQHDIAVGPDARPPQSDGVAPLS